MSRASQHIGRGHWLGWTVLAAIVAIAAIACSTAEPTSTPVPTIAPTPTSEPTSTSEPEVASEPSGGVFEEPEQEWIGRSDSEDARIILATPDLAPGTRRFGIVLTDSSGVVAFPVIQVESFKYPDGSHDQTDREGPIEAALARYHPFPYGTRGIHVTELDFNEPGTWGVEASVPQPDGSVVNLEVVMEVHERTKSVDIGEVPPLSRSRTVNDVEDIADLTTGSQRDESLYQISVGDALQNGKPTVIVFASPAFCTNAVCGPQVEVLSNLSSRYGDQADFIHVDLFTNPQEIKGDLTRAQPSPLLSEWGLVSQEWTFVMDGDGVVVGRYENFVPEEELEPDLMSVLAAEQSPPTATTAPPSASPLPTTVPTQKSDEAGGSTGTRIDIDFDTSWQDLFDQLSDSEQVCIRDAVGDELLASFAERQVIEEREPEPWEDQLFECLAPATVESVFLSSLLATTEGMSEESLACIEGLIDDTDVSQVIDGGKPDASSESQQITAEFYGGLMTCSLLGMIGNVGAAEEQRVCLAQLLANSNMAQIYLGSQPNADPEATSQFEAFMGGLFVCLGDLLQEALQQASDELSAPQ